MDGVWRRPTAADGTITCSSKLEGGKTEPCLLLLQNLSFCHRPATPIITYSPQNGITVLAKEGCRSRSFYMNVVLPPGGEMLQYIFSVRNG